MTTASTHISNPEWHDSEARLRVTGGSVHTQSGVCIPNPGDNEYGIALPAVVDTLEAAESGSSMEFLLRGAFHRTPHEEIYPKHREGSPNLDVSDRYSGAMKK